MLDDIVELPRPLAHRKGHAVLASYRPYEIPQSPLGKYYGSMDINRDLPICVGNSFSLITGKDSPYRYKFIEHSEKEIIEYVAMLDAPFGYPNAKIFVLWVNHVNKSNLRVKREYCWDNIIAAREHFGFEPVEIVSRVVKDELETSVGMIYPGATRAYAWAHEPGSVFEDENTELERLMLLRENAKAFDDAWDMDYMPLMEDVYRGCAKDENKNLRVFTMSGRTLPFNVMSPKDILKMRSPYLNIGPYQFCLNRTNTYLDKMVIDGLTEFSGWFEVLKYIELIPYGEVFIQSTNNNFDVMRIYDPYDPGHIIKFPIEEAQSVIDVVRDVVPAFKRLSVYRSWGEEAYITVTNKNGATTQFYFDIFHAVLGTKLLEEKKDV